MGTLSKGDLVLFPFPFTDLSDRKLRPCLVLSEQMGEDILLCQISSRRPASHSVPISTAESGLVADSHIRYTMLFTAKAALIVKKVGRIPRHTYQSVIEKIGQLME